MVPEPIKQGKPRALPAVFSTQTDHGPRAVRGCPRPGRKASIRLGSNGSITLERFAGHQEKRSSCAGPRFARWRTGVTDPMAMTGLAGWPALARGGKRLARLFAVLGLVTSSAGCILTKVLPDPALDI